MQRAQPPGALLAVAGLGLIGTSIALRALELGWRVCGWDPNPAHLEWARARGAISAAETSLEALDGVADVLILAGPPDAILAQLETFAQRPPAAPLVLDVASVKAQIARAGAPLRAFVATHPIAGSERSGPEAASPRFFDDRVWTYDPAGEPASVARARAFIAGMGARPVAVASSEHDRIVALTSHLPQVVAVALGAQLLPRLNDENVAALCGSGMRSMLRLGGSGWPIWHAILAANGASVAQEVRRLADILHRAADVLEAGDSQALVTHFEASARAVERLSQPSAVFDAAPAEAKHWDER